MTVDLKPYPAMMDASVPWLGKVPAADAWYVLHSVRTGYEISFTRCFYKPQPLRALKEIRAAILALERETEGLVGEIIGGAGR